MSEISRLSSRDALVEAAFTVFSRNPGAPLAEVARRAGVGRATLHRHFSSREDLMLTLARMAILEMDQAAEVACADADSHGDALKRTLSALIPLGDRHGFLALQPVDDDPEIMAEFERQLEETRELVDAARKEGAFDPSVPTEWIVQAFVHLLYAAWEGVRTGTVTSAQAADLAWQTLTTGLGGRR